MAGPTGPGYGANGPHTPRMRSRPPVRILTIVLAATVLAGCGSGVQPGPRTIDGGFPAQGDIAALPVRVSDLTGVIRRVSIVGADAGHEGVSQVPGRDDALYLQWIGGMCDRSAAVVVDRTAANVLVTISTERDFGGCLLAGISRTLMLEFDEPVDASTVTLELLD